MGGGSAGGGTAESYPVYVKDFHKNILWHDGAVRVSRSYSQAANTAFSYNPFSPMLAYDPTAQITAMLSAISTLNLLGSGDTYISIWQDAVQSAIDFYNANIDSEVQISADAQAFADEVDEEIEQGILPRFQRGMQDINSVMSSAYVIGQAVIENAGLTKKAYHLSQLRTAIIKERSLFIVSSIEGMSKNYMFLGEFKKAITTLEVEARRIGIVAGKEQDDQDYKIEEAEAKWNFEVLQYGANIMSALHGAVSHGPSQKTNPTMSAIGGGLSGAASGAAMGSQILPGWGTAIGAVVGAAAGIFGALS